MNLSSENDFYRNQNLEFPIRKSKESLKAFSKEVIPVIAPTGAPKLIDFLEPIIQRNAQTSRWLTNKQIEGKTINPEELERDIVFFVGLPGSGKSHALRIFNERLQAAHIRNINMFSWEDADEKHTSDKKKRYAARPLSSDLTMQEANQRAIEIFNSRSRWQIATGEYAPFGMRDPQTGTWNGRDAGATFLESVVSTNQQQEIKSNIHIVGLCSDSSLDWFVNPNREQGAYMNQVMLYKAHAYELTKKVHDTIPQIPQYLHDYLDGRNSNPLLYPEFKYQYVPHLKDVAYNLLPIELNRYFEKNKIGEKIKNHPYDISKFWPPAYFEQKPFFEECLIKVARNNCESVAPLYLMNQFFTDLGIPSDNIYMGLNAPTSIDSKEGNMNLYDYLQNTYSLKDV